MSKPEKKTEMGLIDLELLGQDFSAEDKKTPSVHDEIEEHQKTYDKFDDAFFPEQSSTSSTVVEPKANETSEDLDILGNPLDSSTKEEESEEEEDNKDDEESVRHRALLKEMFGDFGPITIDGEDGEPVEVTIDDIKIDKDTFTYLVKQKMAYEKEQAQTGKVSVDGLSDITKAMIEVEHNGGDVRNLLGIRQKFYDPISQIDTSTEEGKEEMIALRLKAKNVDPEEIEATIAGHKARGTFEKAAENAEAELKALINRALENEKEKARLEAEQREEDKKVYKKTLKDSLKRFELNDKVISKIVDIATQVDQTGNYEIDRVYSEVIKDPSKAADLTLFLLDKEEYDRQVSNKKVLEAKVDQITAIRLGPKKGAIHMEKKGKEEKGLIDLTQL